MKKLTKENAYPLLLVVASSVGLTASFWQAAERVHMLKFPAEPLSCNISPIVDCSGVLTNKLAAVFGPPNAFIGMVVFALLLAFGLSRLTGGGWSIFVRKLTLGLSLLIFFFSLWFFYVSLYILGKICIFCVFIWAASMPIGIYGVRDYLQNSKPKKAWLLYLANFLTKNHLDTLVVTYIILIALYLLRFSEYYFGRI